MIRRSFFSVALLIFVASQHPLPGARKPTQPEQQQTQSTNQPSTSEQRGSQDSPVFVRVIPSPKTQAEIDENSEERQQQSSHERWTIVISGILAVIALGQLAVYWYQAIQLRRTVESAGEQSKAMNRHIDEAARSATAMENIAEVIESGNAAIMRAYLSVIIGDAVYQERQDGLKFEGKPNLVNTGSTPARNVHVRIAAELVPDDQAETFTYPLPEESTKASAVAAPHQTYILNAVVKDFVPDVEVPDIKRGQGKALIVWGVITYDDIFGKSHTTKFGQSLLWYPNQRVYGYYIPGRNDMD